LTTVLASAEHFGYQSDSLAETRFNGLVAALLSRQRDVSNRIGPLNKDSGGSRSERLRGRCRGASG